MQENISMLKLREIFRLRYENRLSVREIGSSCSIGRQTVANYIALAKISGINWDIDKNLEDNDLEAKLYKGKKKDEKSKIQSSKPVPSFEYIDIELKKTGVTLLLLWSEYKQENPEGYQYEMFCLLYRSWKQKQNVCMRQNYKAGEKLFIDYSGKKIPIHSVTGEITMAELFVTAWGASNYIYAEATESQRLPDWVMSHVHAFEYFGCVPKVCVLDNLKSGINKACKYEPDINRTYFNMIQYYKTVAFPARPHEPKDKAKVEVSVLIAQRWIIAVLRNRRFYSLGELNIAIRELLEIINNKVMKITKKSRKELFEMLDKPNALPLPEKPYEYSEWKKCRVNIDYHVEIDGHYYSVPYQLNKEQVDVRHTARIIEIFFRNKRVASHIRNNNKGRHTTIPEHMPESHRKYLEWTPTRIIDWAGKTGPNIKELVKEILESREYPEQGYRSCLGIMNLQKYYPVERLEKACSRAIRFKLYSYRSVKNILKLKMDLQPEPKTENKTVPTIHENIRGEMYYSGAYESLPLLK